MVSARRSVPAMTRTVPALLGWMRKRALFLTKLIRTAGRPAANRSIAGLSAQLDLPRLSKRPVRRASARARDPYAEHVARKT